MFKRNFGFLLLPFLFAFSSAVEAKDEVVNINLFKWAASGLDISFPQTFVIDKSNGLDYGRLTFESESDYLKSWGSNKKEGSFDLGKVEKNFPELYGKIKKAWEINEKVLVTVIVDSTVSDCSPCSQQKEVLNEKDYFGLPHIEVTLSK
ncbi:hypothetical protein PALB_7630 [Pseudoalteromonas luteoviolacea B = ATCC 29581]|nr:hypothetical protein PALB_7630 [Pseudoalteromonas luteoviolacea B = ATCC 29581]